MWTYTDLQRAEHAALLSSAVTLKMTHIQICQSRIKLCHVCVDCMVIVGGGIMVLVVVVVMVVFVDCLLICFSQIGLFFFCFISPDTASLNLSFHMLVIT